MSIHILFLSINRRAIKFLDNQPALRAWAMIHGQKGKVRALDMCDANMTMYTGLYRHFRGNRHESVRTLYKKRSPDPALEHAEHTTALKPKGST